MTNKCLRCKDMIHDYLDFELDEKSKAEMFEHMETCPECQGYFQDMRLLTGVMNEDLFVELPSQFEETLHTKLIDASKESGKKSKVIQFLTYKRIVPTLALAATFLFTTTFVLDNFGGLGSKEEMALGSPGADYGVMSSKSAAPEMAPVAPTAMTMDGVAPDPSVTNNQPNLPSNQPKIIRYANSNLEVKSASAAMKSITALVSSMNGYIENSNYGEQPIYSNSGKVTSITNNAYFHIRIPDQKLEAFLDEAAKLGKETNRSTSSSDISTIYTDTQAQIKNLESREKSLRTLLEKAKDIKDLLEIDRELASVRTRIDSYTSSKTMYDNQITYATIDINVIEATYKQMNFLDTMKRALSDAFDLALKALEKGIYVTALMAPFALLVGVIMVIVNKLKKNGGKKDEKNI